MEEVFVAPGEKLASEGEFAYHLFVIEEGTASVLIGDSTVRELGPGDVFGEVGLLVTGRRTATVVATTPMTLATIFDASYRRLERELPAVGRLAPPRRGRAGWLSPRAARAPAAAAGRDDEVGAVDAVTRLASSCLRVLHADVRRVELRRRAARSGATPARRSPGSSLWKRSASR